jgi:NAD+ synthetase
VTLSELLQQLRAARGFDPQHALTAKLDRIMGYFDDCGLDAAVVGVSGGIDSAVVLALLCAAMRAPGSPLRRVVGVLAPIGGRGGTGQERALRRGQAAIAAASAEGWRCDLSAAQAGYVAAFADHARSTAWAEGQLTSVVRTPAFYYAAALLQAAGHRSLVAGTTNRDEGAWLGFFGKASDGMVDLQPISDLHKSEVCALAARLGVPDEIIAATPRGDVYDGRVDEEMIGAPYWFVELFLLLRCQGGAGEVALAALRPDERALYDRHAAALWELHRHNAHKYRVGSPAIHLDVYPRAVPGGW